MNGNSDVYIQLTLLLLVISHTWRENLAKFSCISQPDSGVSLAQILPGFLAFHSHTLEYPRLKFHQVFLRFTARLWCILGLNLTIFSCILHPYSGVSLAQISPSFLAFHSQTLVYPWLEFNHIFLHFTPRLWSILDSNFTKFSYILQPDCGVSLARISPSFLTFYSQTLVYPQLDNPSNQSTLHVAVGPVLTYVILWVIHWFPPYWRESHRKR